jgi:salicylate hydroxylase
MAETIIVGGGIGGLAAALAAARRGHFVRVLERAPQFAELGAGIQVAPNGIHALARLGLGEQVRDIAVRMDELRLMDALTGRRVAGMPLTEDYQDRFGAPYLVVHRAELHRLLLRACLAEPTVDLRGDAPVAGYRRSGEGTGVAAVLESGELVHGDALVGADGVHSAIRAQLVGDGAPRVAGITVYRAIVPMDRVPEDLRYTDVVAWWTGPGCHLVHYPIGGGRFLNLAPSKETGVTEPFAGLPVPSGTVLDELSVLGGDARRLLELGEDWKTWSLIDRDPVRTWTDGPVALLGDAAHPMTPDLGQGGSQSIEDAVVLAKVLAAADGDPRALASYSTARLPRTMDIVKRSKRMAAFHHASTPVGVFLRGQALRLSSSERTVGLFLRSFDPVFGWKP